MDEIDSLIELANARKSAATAERLRKDRNALADIRSEFSATFENLQELANRTEAIETDLADVVELLEVEENEQGFHCALAFGRLSAEAKIARGEGLA